MVRGVVEGSDMRLLAVLLAVVFVFNVRASEELRSLKDSSSLDIKFMYIDIVKKKIEGEGRTETLRKRISYLRSSLERYRRLSQSDDSSQIELLMAQVKLETEVFEEEINGLELLRYDVIIDLLQIISKGNGSDSEDKERIKELFRKSQGLALEAEIVKLKKMENQLLHASTLSERYRLLIEKRAISKAEYLQKKTNLELLEIEARTQRRKIDFLKAQI